MIIPDGHTCEDSSDLTLSRSRVAASAESLQCVARSIRADHTCSKLLRAISSYLQCRTQMRGQPLSSGCGMKGTSPITGAPVSLDTIVDNVAVRQFNANLLVSPSCILCFCSIVETGSHKSVQCLAPRGALAVSLSAKSAFIEDRATVASSQTRKAWPPYRLQ